MNNIKSEKLKFTVLSTEEIKKVYEEHMVYDFPKKELKPLSHIYDMIKAGIYLPYGIYEGSEMMGYAFLVFNKAQRLALLDYFAIFRGKRDGGMGSKALSCMKEMKDDFDLIVLEVEIPEEAEDDTDKDLRQRRIGFYERNGAYRTNIITRIYDANYLILQFPLKEKYSDKEMLATVNKMYHTMFSDKIFNSKVKISVIE